MHQARNPSRAGHSLAVAGVRACRLVLLVAPLMMGACSSSESADSQINSSPSGGGRSSGIVASGGSSVNIGVGGMSYGGASKSSNASVGGTAASDSSGQDSTSGGGGYAGNGGAALGGKSSSAASSPGGVSAGGASSSGSSSSKGGAGLGGLSASSGRAGSVGASSSFASGSAAPSGGAAGAGGATSGSKGNTGMGGMTGTGGRTSGTGTAAGGSTYYPPGPDAGVSAMDAGISTGGACSFSGGPVTSTLYPSGLTLRKSCSPYFVSSISIYDDGVLTIEPGVTVKFGGNGVLSVGVQGAGRLVASGSSSELITFTSQQAQPSPGQWRGLWFDGGTVSGSKIAYAQITAAGQNGDGALVGTPELPAHALTIDHLTIDMVGDASSGIVAYGEKSAITITNSTFVDIPAGRYPISVYASSFSSIGAGNTYPSGSAIEVMGGTIDASVTWGNPGLPVVITEDLFVQGASNPVLTVASGMNLKFGNNVAVQVGKSASGKITLAGTSSARISLTSSSGAPGSWAGLQIWDAGKATISYADLRYGGTNNGDSRGNITIESSAATVQLAVDHASFSDSLGWGINVPCASSNQNAAIITVDSNTTYANNALGTKGPGLTCGL